MSEEGAIAVAATAAGVVVVAIVLGVVLSVDSIANCARSCGGKMTKYTEEPRMGSTSRVPVCECAP